MTAIAFDHWQEQEDDPEVRIDGRVDPQVEEAYWQSVYWAEPYYRAQLSYEDYAPAYCVGYIGYAQYGGCYADAEKSLCANWVRIKGDSRLTLEEAMQAVQAAWAHAERSASGREEDVEELLAMGALAAQRGQRQPQLAVA